MFSTPSTPPIRRRTDGSTPSPVHDERVFAVALLYDLVSIGRTDDAGRLHRFFAGVHDNLIGDFLRWYDVFSTMDDRITAQEWLDVAIALDPTHPAVLERSRRSPGAWVRKLDCGPPAATESLLEVYG